MKSVPQLIEGPGGEIEVLVYPRDFFPKGVERPPTHYDFRSAPHDESRAWLLRQLFPKG